MIELNRGVQVITRAEWDARPARTVSWITGSFGSTCHWEGPHMGWPWHHQACFSKVRGIQNFHMDGKRWSDVAYSSLVCPHGFVFEGRWLGVRTAANGTNDGNNRAFAHCYLGGEGDSFTEDGRRAMRAVLDHFDVNGAGGDRNGHRDWKPTACPGDDIYLWVHSGQHAPGGATAAPAPPVPKEDDDMANLVECSTEDKGIWLLHGDVMVQLTTHEAVNEWIKAKATIGPRLPIGDFEGLRNAKNADEYQQTAINLQLEDIRAQMRD